MLGFIAASVPNSRCNIIAIANLVPMVCAILMWKLPRTIRQEEDGVHSQLFAMAAGVGHWKRSGQNVWRPIGVEVEAAT
jgi:hypothetical protein